MEKFGIFDLISALSSLSASEKAEPVPPQESEPRTQAGTPASGVFTAEERRSRAAEMLERHEKIAGRIRKR